MKWLVSILSFFTVKRVILILATLIIIAGLAVTLIVASSNVAVLNPGGLIAQSEKDLIIFTTLLGMIIVVPVFFLLFFFAWRYRASNQKRKAKYTPDVEGNWKLESIWWGIPLIIIIVLAVVTWISSHQLDPYKKIASEKEALKVQVVALEWKWLFIYPEQKVASMNELWIPVDRPVDFSITADAPMSTFWIPNLGSQIYAMKGMTTKLSLVANKAGDYFGTNTNVNGAGYSKMTFATKAVSESRFSQWTNDHELFNENHLHWEDYIAMTEPSTDDGSSYYHIHDVAIFDKIVNQYMSHGGNGAETSHDTMKQMEGY